MEKRLSKKGEVYFRFFDFAIDVNVLLYKEIEPLGLLPDHPTGEFEPERLEVLTKFCSENPDYHIVSFLWDGTMLNRAAANAYSYRLADGDANPRLVVKDPSFLKLGMER